jgi:competence protein ComEA
MKLRSVSAHITLLAMGVCFAAAAAHAKKTPPAHSVDLNTATIKELEQLPGVGPTTAKAIVAFRAKSGRFRRIEDLLAIRGISETKLAKMRPYIIISPAPKKTQ